MEVDMETTPTANNQENSRKNFSPVDAQVKILLRRESERLTVLFGGKFSSTIVHKCVVESFIHLEKCARIRQHLPVLAARRAQRRVEYIWNGKGSAQL
jgi:hypothetical protein